MPIQKYRRTIADGNDWVMAPWNQIFIITTAASASVFLFKISIAIYNNAALNHVAGAWIGLAMDMSEGIFYRPLFSIENGFGGTRFFPLFFSIHALLIKFGIEPILSGHIVSILSGVVLFVGCFFVLKEFDVKPVHMIGLFVLLLGEDSIQVGLSSIRGDVLPLALNISGIAVFFSKTDNKYKTLFSSLFFTLAFATKITAVTGLITMIVWLLISKRKKESIKLFFITSLGYTIFLSTAYFSSSKRLYTIFKTCSSGGAGIANIINAPIAFVKNISETDPVCLLLIFWAILVISKHREKLFYNILFIFFLVSFAVTIFIYGSPGIDNNHLVDLAVSSILLVGSASFSLTGKDIRSPIIICVLLLIFSVVHNIPSLKKVRSNNFKHRYPKEIVEIVKGSKASILVEDPLLTIIAGKKPYLLDPFMMRLMIAKDQSIKSAVFNFIDEKKIPKIIFKNDPKINSRWYSAWHFGDAFIQKVLDNYEEEKRIKNFFIYLPK